MRRTNIITAAVLAGLVSSSAARAATEDFKLVDQSVEVDKKGGTATFRLNFDREPNFTPSEGGGGQDNAFQIDIDGDSTTFETPLLFEEIDSVVRGAEIAGNDGIPVRDREGDGGGDEAGGWGPVRDILPFELEGSTLTFTAALETIGDQDGKFRYRIITIDNGGITSEVSAAIIPLPAALGGGMMMLGGAGLVHKLRKRRFC